ncbi:hypothetical protein LAUMK136_05560 [Mycobacterium attenuatum]|uniref:Secreted protein n=1 Tax=Mycobacterium attenuatum TaxID=2341086 RepID=A0A498QIG7_9MYCO|nr:hypothetical protein LAUMK136_05560 [Mycobacterium attenuatum]
MHSNAYGKVLFAITLTAAAVLVALAAEPMPKPPSGQCHQYRSGGESDGEEHLAVGVGVHRQPHRLAQRHAVGGLEGHVDGDPLGEVDFDRYPQRQVSGRQLDLAHVGDRHARGSIDLQLDPDRYGEAIVQR